MTYDLIKESTSQIMLNSIKEVIKCYFYHTFIYFKKKIWLLQIAFRACIESFEFDTIRVQYLVYRIKKIYIPVSCKLQRYRLTHRCPNSDDKFCCPDPDRSIRRCGCPASSRC